MRRRGPVCARRRTDASRLLRRRSRRILVGDGLRRTVTDRTRHRRKHHAIRDIGVGQQYLAKLERNRSFGEVALLTNSPRTASVVAETKVRLIKITKENLSHLSAENPRIAMQIYRILAESLAQSLRQTGTIPSQLR